MKLSRKITALKNWKDPSIRKNRIDGLHKVSEESQQNRIRKVLKACLVKPNRQEIVLDRIIQQVVPNIYTYVGNAKIFIGRFNPDFIDNSHTKIIELFGDYWHKKSEVIERDNRRLATYKNRGYNALIIWEHELKNVKEVTLKIKQFTEYIGGTK
jgi:G:T-mismatch repair DNA endonuclease (very short patch repair protein)